MIQVENIPAAYGISFPTSSYGRSGKAQQVADQDAEGAVRVVGCARFNAEVLVNPSTTGSTVNGGFGGLQADQAYAIINPNTVDPRLLAESQTYQYYAFRDIETIYIPAVGTNTPGIVHMAISKDADQADTMFEVVNNLNTTVTPQPTSQTVMEHMGSMETQVYKDRSMRFRHRGTELWQTFPNGEEPTNERIQATYVCVVNTPAVSTPTTFGEIWMRYVIDFYVPGPPPLVITDQSPAEIRTLTPQTAVTLTTAPTLVGTIASAVGLPAGAVEVLVNLNNASGSATEGTITLNNGTALTYDYPTNANSVVQAFLSNYNPLNNLTVSLATTTSSLVTDISGVIKAFGSGLQVPIT